MQTLNHMRVAFWRLRQNDQGNNIFWFQTHNRFNSFSLADYVNPN